MKRIFTEKETCLILELRNSVGDELLEDEFEKTDDFIITWLQSANYDIKKAEQTLLNNRKWRRENNLDRILLEDMKDLHEAFPFDLTPGFDKFGCPTMAAQFKWDIKRIVNGSPEGGHRVVRYFMKHLEETIKILRQQYFRTDGRVTKFNIIVDMDGFSYRQLLSPRALTDVAKMAEDNYPLTAKAVFFINIPRAFKILFNIMKPFLSGDTISRIKLFDSNKSNWIEALLQEISEDQLPSFLQ